MKKEYIIDIKHDWHVFKFKQFFPHFTFDNDDMKSSKRQVFLIVDFLVEILLIVV